MYPTFDHQKTIARWKARALKAEQHLRRLGAINTPSAYSDDEYLDIVMERPDGTEATIEEIEAARKRLKEGL
jgi:hypothetical protein